MKHIPVLLKESVDGLNVKPGGLYIDATFGEGGHAAEIAKRGGRVFGIDTDQTAKAVYGNFRDIEKIAIKHGFSIVDGVIFDLGVSSIQLDTPERGFSYRFKGPLDLRFDQTKGRPATELVNKYSEGELYEIFSKFGEEIDARAIARAIVRSRKLKPIRTTEQLVDIVDGNYALLSRIFQALRIEVNDELEALRQGLIGAARLLKAGGRLVVISFHSLEDRIVKNFIKTNTFKVLTKKPIKPNRDEIKANPRSRSAKLRIGERL